MRVGTCGGVIESDGLEPVESIDWDAVYVGAVDSACILGTIEIGFSDQPHIESSRSPGSYMREDAFVFYGVEIDGFLKRSGISDDRVLGGVL